MTADERRLVRHLTWLVIIKLLALSGLWWAFVREPRATADATDAARHLSVPPIRGGSR